MLVPAVLPAAAPAGGGAEVKYHEGGHEMGQIRFTWPVAGWARGFRIAIRDGAGRPLPRELLHHINLMHLDRRQLLTPLYERSLAVGKETGDAMLPRSTGVRLEAGAEMALQSAWSNETGKDYGEVILELTLCYLPANIAPRPVDVRPLVMDVGYMPGVNNTFDVGPGRTVHRREFLMPIDGRLLGVGGHLHDYAESLDLVDVATGRVLVALRPTADASGRVTGMSRELYGVSGEGVRLRAGRRWTAPIRNSWRIWWSWTGKGGVSRRRTGTSTRTHRSPGRHGVRGIGVAWARRDSNARPLTPEASALSS